MKVVSILGLALGASAYRSSYMEESLLIQNVNSNIHAKWYAEKSGYFANHTIEQISSMMRTNVATHAPMEESERPIFSESFLQSVPETFDAREKWSDCVGEVRNQQRCGSCWAFGATESLSDRFCIQGKKLGDLSPQNLLSCDGSCFGCNGGTLPGAWNYLKRVGVVLDSCQPYISGTGKTGHCSHTCSDGEDVVYYKAKSSYSVTTFMDLFEGKTVSKIKAEVFSSGPVEVAFTVYQDFMSYKGGVYHHITGPQMGGHAVKLIGWTEDAWIIQNSWGPAWGEGGTFRIRMGSNECGIESNVYAGAPK
eukprot:Awhi_evm1s2033